MKNTKRLLKNLRAQLSTGIEHHVDSILSFSKTFEEEKICKLDWVHIQRPC